ncbi:hypothetical protein ACOSQ2_022958 [Xanthoceras sorbifolium]
MERLKATLSGSSCLFKGKKIQKCYSIKSSLVASGMTNNASIQVIHEPALRPGKEQEEHPYSTSTKGCSEEEETALVTSLYGICPPDLALKFRDLIGNWVPLRVQSECIDFGDEEWLFELKHNQKSRRSEEDVVDIYALPFTVPY